VTVARQGKSASARPTAAAISSTLNAFYQHAFLDRKAWAGEVPATAWEAFAPSIRARARRDAESLSIGEPDGTIETLEATNGTLVVHVLLDQNGRPTAAFADARFSAGGTLKEGGPILVDNFVHYLLRPIGQTWVVYGYVGASTDVQTPAPSSSASPTLGASP
jgi:hypothetical protein